MSDDEVVASDVPPGYLLKYARFEKLDKFKGHTGYSRSKASIDSFNMWHIKGTRASLLFRPMSFLRTKHDDPPGRG